MEHKKRIIIALDNEPENENTIATTRRHYFNTGTLHTAQPVVPLTPVAPGPGLVIPVRGSGFSWRWLAMVAATALLCGIFGGLLIGRARQNATPEQDLTVTVPDSETAAPSTPTVQPAPEVVAPAPLATDAPEAAWIAQNESKSGQKKPLLKPAKVAPKASEPAPNPAPDAEPADDKGPASPNNGESRPRRTRSGVERSAKLTRHDDDKAGPNGRDDNH